MSSLIAFITADAVLDTPVIPGSWDSRVETNRWTTIWPLGRGGVSFAARLIARQSGQPTHALFVCIGGAGVLTRLANQIALDNLPFTATWATLGALRADNGATATAVKAAWPDERPGGVGTLVALYARVAGMDAQDGES